LEIKIDTKSISYIIEEMKIQKTMRELEELDRKTGFMRKGMAKTWDALCDKIPELHDQKGKYAVE